MDLNNILSLLKGQNIVTPPTNNTPSIPLPSNSGTLDISNLDLSSINPNVIEQVRNEYLNSKSVDTTATSPPQQPLEDKIKNATTITPEVLVAIGTMVKETNLIQTLKSCKARQDKKERELYSHRESVKERYKKQKDSLLAKELIGVKASPEELRNIERELNKELYELDLQIIKDFDKEVQYLQTEFVKLNVPLFKVSNKEQDIKLQQKILFMLQDMIE